MVLGRRPSKTRGFFTFFNSPARPSADFGLVDLRKLVVFCDFQITRATLCGLSAGRPSKTRGFLRFSNRSRGPLRSFAWSNRSRCGAALIFLKLRTLNRCRASGICSRAFLARAPNRGQAIGIASEALLILRKLVFFLIFNLPARPSAEFGLVDLRKLVVFCDFQIARATLCGVSRGRIALVVARRYLNRCQASGICAKLAASSKPSPSHGNCF